MTSKQKQELDREEQHKQTQNVQQAENSYNTTTEEVDPHIQAEASDEVVAEHNENIAGINEDPVHREDENKENENPNRNQQTVDENKRKQNDTSQD